MNWKCAHFRCPVETFELSLPPSPGKEKQTQTCVYWREHSWTIRGTRVCNIAEKIMFAKPMDMLLFEFNFSIWYDSNNKQNTSGKRIPKLHIIYKYIHSHTHKKKKYVIITIRSCIDHYQIPFHTCLQIYNFRWSNLSHIYPKTTRYAEYSS